MKFKVGDKVRVRTDLEAGQCYGNYGFVSDMAYYRGRVVTIRYSDDYEESYQLAEDEDAYCWTDEMLEPIGDES